MNEMYCTKKCLICLDVMIHFDTISKILHLWSNFCTVNSCFLVKSLQLFGAWNWWCRWINSRVILLWISQLIVWRPRYLPVSCYHIVAVCSVHSHVTIQITRLREATNTEKKQITISAWSFVPAHIAWKSNDVRELGFINCIYVCDAGSLHLCVGGILRTAQHNTHTPI